MRVTGAKKNEKLTTVSEPVLINTTKPRIHNIFIIDASGSMEGDKYNNAIVGVNEILNSIRIDNDSDNNVMIVEFEGNRIVRRLPLTDVVPIGYKGMGCGGMTPLNQAIGETLEYVETTRNLTFNPNDKVLVNIFTDGGENSSRGKYSNPKELKSFLEELKSKGFTVTFIGTQEEVNYAVKSLGIVASNTLVHDNTSRGVEVSFMRTLKSRQAYSKAVADGEDVLGDFYTKTAE